MLLRYIWRPQINVWKTNITKISSKTEIAVRRRATKGREIKIT